MMTKDEIKNKSNVAIRLFQPADLDAVVILWRVAREVAMPEFQRTKGHTFEEDCNYFKNVILENDDVWVAHSLYGHTVGHLKNNGKRNN